MCASWLHAVLRYLSRDYASAVTKDRLAVRGVVTGPCRQLGLTARVGGKTETGGDALVLWSRQD